MHDLAMKVKESESSIKNGIRSHYLLTNREPAPTHPSRPDSNVTFIGRLSLFFFKQSLLFLLIDSNRVLCILQR